jgi:hypothetical protein
MNAKTAKLLNKVATAKGLNRRALKRRWNALPRPLRGDQRLALQTILMES